MKKLVIFDLDGTLLNSITDLGMAANYALKKNGFAEHDIERYPFFVGNGVRKLIERVLPPATGNEKTIERMLVDFKEYYNCHNTDFTEPYPARSCVEVARLPKDVLVECEVIAEL